MKTTLSRLRNHAHATLAGGRLLLVCLVAAIPASTLLAAAPLPSAKPMHLTVDSFDHPLGIDSTQPQCSWQLQDSTFGANQTAYRIKVATKPAFLAGESPDVWDSGKVSSGQSVH